MIPADLDGIVVGVFGLDNRPQARPHFRIRKSAASRRPRPPRPAIRNSLRSRSPSSTTFPANLDGPGECIAIIELGGGFKTADLEDLLLEPGPARRPRSRAFRWTTASNTPTGKARRT